MATLSSPPKLDRPQTSQIRRSPGFSAFWVLLLLVLVAAFSLFILQPPAVVPANAPASEFSAERAVPFIKATSAVPHWVGSTENTQVRDVIMRELKNLGLTPQLQTATLASGGTVAQVENVLARLPGTSNTRAILLVAHYDGVPNSPGASAMGAVGAMLETLRALRAGPPLKNDVIFLATDGAEIGQFGAQAFLQEHPWAREIGPVLHFGSAGNGGPVLLRQVGADSGGLVQQYATASPYPAGSSLFDSFFRDSSASDFQPFLNGRYAGLELAYTQDRIYERTQADTFDNLDLRSVQQLGAQGLALVRHLGGLDLFNLKTPDLIYFNLFGWWMVGYPLWLSFPLAVAAGLLFVVLTAWGIRRQHLRPLNLALSAAVFAVSAALASVVVYVAWQLLSKQGHLSLGAGGATYNDEWFQAGLLLLGGAVTLALLSFARPLLSAPNLAFGAMFWWVLATLVTGVAAPGASYLALWPLCLGLLAWGLTLGFPPESRRGLVFRLLCLLLPVSLITVGVWLILLELHAQGAFLASFAVSLLLGLLVPTLDGVKMERAWLLPAGTGLVGLILLGYALYLSRPTGPQPQTTAGIRYALNADSGKAIWFSTEAEFQPDNWSNQFLNGEKGSIAEVLPFYQGESYHNEAPALPLAASKMEIIDDRASESVRTLRLKISSPRQAAGNLLLYFPAQTQFRSLVLNGRSVTLDEKRILTCYGCPKEGVELTIQVAPNAPVTFTVRDQSQGLSTLLPGKTIRPRPDTLMPLPATGLDNVPESMLVVKSFFIPPLP